MKSFNQQLSRIVLLVASLAVLLSSLAYFLVETHFSRQADIEHLFPLAETLAINLKPYIGRKDSYKSREILATLEADPNIHSAFLFKADDQPLTYYKRTETGNSTIFRSDIAELLQEERVLPILRTNAREVLSAKGYLVVFSPIFHEGRKIGTICLVTHLPRLNQRLMIWGLLALAISGTALAFGMLLTRHLSSSISAPVLRLADKMQRVSTQLDFSTHVEKKPVNEIEMLVFGFNEMLGRLSQHERQLEAINASLEIRIKERTEELSSLLAEKDLLLREVHHRVKNNLQVIASLLTLQIKNCMEPNVAQLLMPSLSRIRSIAVIHEKLYATEISSTIDVATYLSALAKEIFRLQAPSGDRIQLQLDLHAASANLDFTINLALILNELLSNALKHAFPNGESGVVQVQQGVTGQTLTLCVSDNGSGFPAEFTENRTSTLGLRLIKGLAEQLHGTFTLTRLEDVTFAYVTCPLPTSSASQDKGPHNEPT